VAYIRSVCRRMGARKPLDLIVVDYIQLMTGPGGSEYEIVTGISKALKALAKETGAAVLALSQLSRKVEERSDKRPMLSDLRASGQIEQDADVVVFLYRDEVYNKTSPDKGRAEAIVAKQRNGRCGMVPLLWRADFRRFDSIVREQDRWGR